MEKSILKLVLVMAALVVTPYLQAAVDWTITEGTHTIGAEDDYRNVSVSNEAHLIVNSGYTSHITTNNFSTVDIYGNLSGSLAVYLNDKSTVNIYGGSVYGIGIGTSISATVNLYGGDIRSITFPETDTFTINIYGKHFSYSGNFLSGEWADGTSFYIEFRNSIYPNDNINLIPEPTSLAILGLGCMFFRIKRNNRGSRI